MGVLESELRSLQSYDPGDKAWQLMDQISPETSGLFARICARFDLLDAEPVDEAPDNAPDTWIRALQSITQALPGSEVLDASNPDLHNRVNNFRSTLDNAWRTWRNEGRPYVRAADIRLAGSAADLDEQMERVKEARAEAEMIRDSLRDVASTVGTLELAKYYSDQASSHQRRSRFALICMVVFSVLLIAGGWWLIHTIPSTDNWPTLARDALARGFAIGAVSYGIAFTARIYRTNTHLEAVYTQKAAALKTFHLFSASVDGDDARILILGELVRAVFTTAGTGVLDGEAERTIIDNAVPLAAALARSSAK